MTRPAKPRRGDFARRRWISLAAQHGLRLVESGECDAAQAAERGMVWLSIEWEHGGWHIRAGTARRAHAQWAAWTADTQRQIEEWLAARVARAAQQASVLVTAETVTPAQIEALRSEASLRGETALVTATFQASAIGRSDMFHRPITPDEHRAARELCATAINRRGGVA